ncbi:hypothetical protein QDZ26_000001, partial [Pluralibacter gergoviae]
VKRRPKGAFLLSAVFNDPNLLQVRVERSETTESPAVTARMASAASHPARPISVKRRPKGAFLLSHVRAKFTRHLAQLSLSCLVYKTSLPLMRLLQASEQRKC